MQEQSLTSKYPKPACVASPKHGEALKTQHASGFTGICSWIHCKAVLDLSGACLKLRMASPQTERSSCA